MNVAHELVEPNPADTPGALPFERHHARYLQERAVDSEWAAYAGLRAVSAEEGAKALGFDKPLRCGGLLIPYPNMPGYARIRLDEGTPRFLAPRGREVPIYLPPDSQLEGEHRLIIVEGPIKALAVQDCFFQAVGLGGVSTTLTKNHTLNQSWQPLALVRREVVILFDSNRATKPDVARAEATLALALQQAGARVKVAALPLGEGGCEPGPDDFLAEHGVDELRKVIDAAVPADPAERFQYIEQKFSAAADREHTVRLLLDDLPFLAALEKLGVGAEKRVVELFRKYKVGSRDVGRAKKQLEQRARETREREPETSSPASPYGIHEGRLCLVRQVRDVVLPDPICNFTATIQREEVLDDGVETQRRFAVVGTSADGHALPEIHVTPSDLNGETWPMSKWGSQATVYGVPRAASHLRAAIQQHSTPTCSTTYTHTGMRKHEGNWIYLHPGGAVGATEVAVRLEDGFQRYRLPAQTEDVCDAVRTSLAVLDIVPTRISAPLHAAIFRAPLQELDYCDAAIALYGQTGSLKSSITAVCLSHYGDFDHDTLPLSWTSTSNAIEANLFKMKDMVAVIDDYVPKSADPGDEFHKKAAQVFRAIGNGTGRQRLNRDLQLRASRPPRALVITTGEQLPEGGSIRARLVTIRIRRNEVDLQKLGLLQQRRDRLPHALRGYIEWLLPRLDDIRRELPALLSQYRTSFKAEGGVHLRAPSAMAHLLVGAHYFAEFAQHIGVFDAVAAENYIRTVRDALVLNNQEQAHLAAQMKPTRRFLDVMRSLLCEGKVRLVSPSAPLAADDATEGRVNIGWEGNDVIHLLPQPAYTAFVQTLRAMGENVPLPKEDLWAQLVEEGLITKGDGKNLLPKRRLGGQRPRVVEFKRTLLRGPTDIDERFAQEFGPQAGDGDDDDDPEDGGDGGDAGPEGAPAPGSGGGSSGLPTSFSPSLRLLHPALLARFRPDVGPTAGDADSLSDSTGYSGWPYRPYLGDEGSSREPDSTQDPSEASTTPAECLPLLGGVGPVGPGHVTGGSVRGMSLSRGDASSGHRSGPAQGSLLDPARFAEAALRAGRVGIAFRRPDAHAGADRSILALALPDGATCALDVAGPDDLGALNEALRAVTVVGHDLRDPLGHLTHRLGIEPRALIDTALLWKLRDGCEHLDKPNYFSFERARAEAGRSSNDNGRVLLPMRGDHGRAIAEARDVLRIADCLGTEIRACGLEEAAALELALLPVIIGMQNAGVPFDREKWRAVVADWERELNQLKSRFDAAGLNVHKQTDVSAALAKKGIYVGRTGSEELAGYLHDPFVQDLVRYRSLHGFVAGPGKEIQHAWDGEGRVHGAWDQLGAATGRMSCSHPNLMGLPRHPQIRGCIQAPQGKKLVVGDYAAIDLRVLADYLEEESLLEVFRKGGDPHRETARRLLGVEPESVTDEARTHAKVINFGLMNGMGAAALVANALEKYNTVMSLAEAEQYKSDYLRLHPRIAGWHEHVKREKIDALRSASGRLRCFSGSDTYSAKLCTPIQGTAADGLKQAMILLAPRLRPLGADIILAVHDELVVEAPEEHAGALKELMRECMVAGMQKFVPSVPIVVNPEIRSTWAK